MLRPASGGGPGARRHPVAEPLDHAGGLVRRRPIRSGGPAAPVRSADVPGPRAALRHVDRGGHPSGADAAREQHVQTLKQRSQSWPPLRFPLPLPSPKPRGNGSGSGSPRRRDPPLFAPAGGPGVAGHPGRSRSDVAQDRRVAPLPMARQLGDAAIAGERRVLAEPVGEVFDEGAQVRAVLRSAERRRPVQAPKRLRPFLGLAVMGAVLLLRVAAEPREECFGVKLALSREPDAFIGDDRTRVELSLSSTGPSTYCLFGLV